MNIREQMLLKIYEAKIAAALEYIKQYGVHRLEESYEMLDYLNKEFEKDLLKLTPLGTALQED